MSKNMNDWIPFNWSNAESVTLPVFSNATVINGRRAGRTAMLDRDARQYVHDTGKPVCMLKPGGVTKWLYEYDGEWLDEKAKEREMSEIEVSIRSIGDAWYAVRGTTPNEEYLRNDGWYDSYPTYYKTREAAKEAKARVDGNPNPLTAPDHVMFRGDRLDMCHDALLGIYSYVGASAGCAAGPKGFNLIAGTNHLVDERHEDGTENNLARLQAWLAKDAEERERKRAADEPTHPAAVPPWTPPEDDVCLECESRFDGIYVLKLKSGICSHCDEKQRVRELSIQRASVNPKRMVYDEPQEHRAPISATAKWHCTHTSVDAKPGWEE